MSTVYLYDGSWEGLLTAVARAVKSSHSVTGISVEKKYFPELFDTLQTIETDEQQAFRLFQYLKNLKGSAARLAMNGFLSDDPEVGLHLYRMVQECLKRGPQATLLRSHESIHYLQQLSQRVERETHKYLGLIRFRILRDGLQYGPFEPDCNVIGYCANHFRRRLKNQQWILHDVRRGHALYWDGLTLQRVDIDEDFTRHVRQYGEVADHQLSEGECYYQGLWKSFHQVIVNRDRENLKLQRQFIPNRYWKYLVEMEG